MDDMAEWTDDGDDAGTVRTMRPEREIDFDYDEVSATTENEFLYEVWKRQARKEHAMFPTTDAMMWALFFGDPRITYEVLPAHDPKGYLA